MAQIKLLLFKINLEAYSASLCAGRNTTYRFRYFDSFIPGRLKVKKSSVQYVLYSHVIIVENYSFILGPDSGRELGNGEI